MVSAQNAPGWINQDGNWAASKQELQAFGERFDTSEALYDALKTGGRRRQAAHLAADGRTGL